MVESRDGDLIQPATLQNLLEHLTAAGVEEIEIVRGDSRLFIRRRPGASAGAGLSSQPADSRHAIVAPLTGVYYGRPKPEDPPFVAVGATVQPGQVVALIETMKLFNEVAADIAGEVVEIAPQEGDLVEAGHALVYIVPAQERVPT